MPCKFKKNRLDVYPLLFDNFPVTKAITPPKTAKVIKAIMIS
jgi:hypothetical protein